MKKISYPSVLPIIIASCRKIENATTKYILYIILLSSLFSCNKKQSIIKREHAICVDLDKEQEVSLNDLFSKVEIIPLTTTDSIIMGDPVLEMRVHNGEYYFLCAKQQLIWHFSEDGHLLHEINHYGNGPDEYSEISDFRFNRFSGDLEILVPQGYINTYNSTDYTFKRRITFDKKKINVVHKFIELTPHSYLLFSSAGEKEKMFWYDIEKNDVIAKHYDLPEFLFFDTPYHHTYTPFYYYNDSVRFVQSYNGDVFTATNDGMLQSTYQFDFGDYNFDISTLEEGKPIDYYIIHSRTTGAKYANRFIAYGENSKYYISRFKFHNHIYHLLLDKKSGKAFCFKKLKEDCYCFPLCIDEKALYFVVSSEELCMAINKNVLSDSDKKKYENISTNDNQIVIKYTFKE